MPFCPKCKIQYRDGFTVCSDCKVPLVDNLSEVKEDILDNADDIIEAANDAEETIEIDAEKVKNMIENPPTEDEINEMKQYINKQRKIAYEKQDFKTTKERSKDLKSTGIMLIVMGTLGAAFITSIIAGIFPFWHISGIVKYVIYTLFDLFFVSFIYFGIQSLISNSKLKEAVSTEETMNKEFIIWFDENITKEAVDAKLPICPDENTNFFMRNERIKMMVFHVFPDMDNSFVEGYIDEHYEDIFS